MKYKIKKLIVILLIITMLIPNFSFAVSKNINEKENLIVKTQNTKKELIKNSQNNIDFESYSKYKKSDDKLTDFEKSKYSKEYLEYLELSDEEKSKLAVIPRKYDVPMSVLYDEEKFGTVGSNGQTSEEVPIPSKFDLRDYIDIPTKDQNPYGTCWAFANLRSLETYLALNGYGDYDFSELHVAFIENNGFFDKEYALNRGGNTEIFADYLTKGCGPVLEENIPYDMEFSEEDFEEILNLTPEVYVDDYCMFPTIRKGDGSNYTDEELELFRTKVKEHIMKNGSVYTAIDSWGMYKNLNDEMVLYTTWPLGPDHAISIIGWDDNYSKENFKVTEEDKIPEHDGAYIALNSWGDEQEVIYISYDDYWVEYELAGIKEVSFEEDVKEIQFEDENLYNAIKEIFANRIESEPNDEEMKLNLRVNSIYNLDLSNRNIKNLSGLENFSKLEILNLNDNEIEDLSPLCNLTELTLLEANRNKISNLGNVSNYKNLWYLSLSNNKLEDVDELRNLSKLLVLDISENEIEDISFVEQLINLRNIEIFNNKISDVSYLENFVERNVDHISFMDFSGNPIKLGLEKILMYFSETVLNNCEIDDDIVEVISQFENLIYLELDNNNITDVSSLSNLELEYLSLSGNKNLDLSSLSNGKFIEEISDGGGYYLILNDCNITDISELENLNYFNKLYLNENPISDVSSFVDRDFKYLSLYDTNVTDVSCLTGVKELSLSGSEFVTGLENLTELVLLDLDGVYSFEGIENLTNLEKLYLTNCNLTDITFVTNFEDLTELDLSNNLITDICCLARLENLYGIYCDNNEISNIDVLKCFDGLGDFSFKNNNITDISNLNGFCCFYLDLRGNFIKRFPNEIITFFGVLVDTPDFSEELILQRNAENYLDIPFMLEFEKEYEYYYGYDKKTEFETTNCELDWENNCIIINATEDGISTITVKTFIVDEETRNLLPIEKTYTINYTVVDNLELEGIYIDSSSKDVYFETDTFNKKDLIVYEVYEGGLTRKTEDYTIVNSTEVTGEDEELVIVSNKNPEFRIQYAIRVYSSEYVTPLKVEDNYLYQILKYDAIYSKGEEKVEPILDFYDDDQIIYYSNLELLNVEGIAFDYNDKTLENLYFLKIFTNLKNIDITAKEIKSLDALTEIANLERVSFNVEDINLESIINSENYEEFVVTGEIGILNVKDTEYVELPNCIYQAIVMQEDCDVNAELTYWKVDGTFGEKELEIVIDEENQKAKLILDKTLFDDAQNMSRAVLIKVESKEYPIFRVRFKAEYYVSEEISEEKIEEIQDLKDNQYIENMTPNTRIFDLRDKISTSGKVEFYKGEERIYDVTEKVATGMTVKIIEEDNVVEYKAVVTGDLTGNGQAEDADLLKLARYKVELDTNLVNEFLEATDIDKNDIPAEDTDLLKFAKILVELAEY